MDGQRVLERPPALLLYVGEQAKDGARAVGDNAALARMLPFDGTKIVVQGLAYFFAGPSGVFVVWSACLRPSTKETSSFWFWMSH